MNHPQVEIIWNFFPFSLLLWGPFREVANFVFFLFRIPYFPFELVLNTITETGPFLVSNILMMVFIEPKEWWIIMITNGLIYTGLTNLRMGLFWIAQLIATIIHQDISEVEEKRCEEDFNYQG